MQIYNAWSLIPVKLLLSMIFAVSRQFEESHNNRQCIFSFEVAGIHGYIETELTHLYYLISTIHIERMLTYITFFTIHIKLFTPFGSFITLVN